MPTIILAPLLDPVLHPLYAAYDAMATARNHRGPLAPDLPERKILLDEKGMMRDINILDRLEVHRLIEEKNAGTETPPYSSIHDEPSSGKLQAPPDFLGLLDIAIKKSDSVRAADFNGILAQSCKVGNVEQVSAMVLRSQARAEYNAENYGHFGLNLDRYAHFDFADPPLCRFDCASRSDRRARSGRQRSDRKRDAASANSRAVFLALSDPVYLHACSRPVPTALSRRPTWARTIIAMSKSAGR